MKNYDALVVGSGSAMVIAEEFLNHGYKVALVDRGPLGGTCLNVGCIPSKMLIYPADRIVEIEEAAKLGIKAAVEEVDFKTIMARMRQTVVATASDIREGIKQVEGLDYYEGEGRFVADYTIEVNGRKIKGANVFLVSGTRPDIPPIRGVEKVNYLTNESLLKLNEKPPSLVIIGGGYVGVEYAHFFAAMGTKVTLLEMAERLIWNEEEEIAALLENKLAKRMVVETGITASEIVKEKDGITVKAVRNKDGAKLEFKAEKLMLATGRRSNADTLNLEKTGVKTDKHGYIEVDNLYRTSKKNIFSCGDAIGRQMFIHVANREASLLANNILHGEEISLDYNAAPHAIFSHPQVASVGLTEAEAQRKGYKTLIGKASYTEIAKGEAMMEKDSFAKAIVDKKNGKILGFHIIGSGASTLIQEVVNVMAADAKAEKINQGIHIHPALSELIPVTLSKLT